jgi:hypothetical protein
VADAKAMESYLQAQFPSARIRSLHNQEATRAAIIQEIRNLIYNPKIKRQDPILIFYAGYGGEAKPPADWDTQGRNIQVLVPYDYNDDGTFISDVAMSTLLEELASKKGDNIVSPYSLKYTLI